MYNCDACGQAIKPDEAFRTFVWLGAAFEPYGTQTKPDVRVHERCLAIWKRPDPYYHDTKEPFPDTGM